MATLTIADLDNGKRDLQTVDAVANSRSVTATTRFGQQTTTLYEAIRRIRADGDEQLEEQKTAAEEVIRSLGFRVPVGYASGIEVTDSRFTVTGPDGKVYAPLSAPFTTGSWNPAQWYVLQNDMNDNKLRVFETLVAAQAAATILPDGQYVDVMDKQVKYRVKSGELVFQENLSAPTVDVLKASNLSPSSTYRKKVKANLPFRGPDYDAQMGIQSGFNGSTAELYPQGFCVDWVARELFILRKGGIVVIEVFDWDTLAYKGCFFTKTDAATYTTASSEQPVVIYFGNTRKLYTKGETRTICRFDITTLPPNMGSVVKDASWNVNVFTSFAYKNGTWIVEDASYAFGTDEYRKSRYIKYDGDFNRTGDFEIGAHVTGLDDSLTAMSSRVTKKQGMCIALGGILFGVGGRRSGAADVYDYRHQGIRLATGAGDIVLDSTVKHALALQILKDNGVTCDFIENEGVQFDDTSGKIFSLYACLDTSSNLEQAKTAGMLILEEFSNEPSAIDFTSAAALNTFHNTRLISGLAPVSTNSSLYNPITGAMFTSWTQITEYMRDCDRELYTYWSSSAPNVLMPDGSEVTTGLRVTIQNTNGTTFFVRGQGLYQDRMWRLVRNTDGTYLSLEFTPRAQRNLLPSADVAVSLGQTDQRWTTLHSRNINLTPPASANPTINGEMVFELTSNTSIRIKVRGSDGVVRSATLTLS